MADITIDDAVRDTEVTGAELFPASDGGSPKAVAAAKVKDYVLAQIAALAAADAVDAASDKVYVLKGGVLKPVPASALAAAVLDYAFSLASIASLNGNEKIAIKDANGRKSMTAAQLKNWATAGLATSQAVAEIAASLGGKVDKVVGKGLSENDYSDEDKAKLDALVSNVQPDWSQSDSTAADFIKNKPSIPQGVVVDLVLDADSQNAVANDAVTNRFADLQEDVDDLDQDMLGKVDKVEGKGLSTNDFTDAHEADVTARISRAATVITNIQGIPADGAKGYPLGALLVWNAEGVRYLYVNIGTITGCAFRRVSLIADEDLGE